MRTFLTFIAFYFEKYITLLLLFIHYQNVYNIYFTFKKKYY